MSTGTLCESPYTSFASLRDFFFVCLFVLLVCFICIIAYLKLEKLVSADLVSIVLSPPSFHLGRMMRPSIFPGFSGFLFSQVNGMYFLLNSLPILLSLFPSKLFVGLSIHIFKIMLTCCLSA